MNDLALQLSGVCKSFGDRVALDGLTFEVPRGAITGLIGPNGAGKTTCFSVVGGLVKPDSGTVNLLGGGPFDPSSRRGELGLLPQDAGLPGHARVGNVLCYLARLQGFSGPQAVAEADRVLADVSLSDRRGSKMSELSHGMRRRVAVAQALIGKPALIMLDEPTSGLDPDLVASMRDLLLEIRTQGRSLIVSSHVLSDLEAICDHVVFMEAGRCLRSASISEVTDRETILNVELAGSIDKTLLFQRLEGLRCNLSEQRLTVVGPAGLTLAELSDRVLSTTLAMGLSVVGLTPGRSLESAYLSARE